MTPLARAVAVDDDLALTRRIVGGERAAFEVLMRRYNRRLFRLARATLRDAAEAEDALQEAYLAAYRCFGQFRGESALGTWLSRLVLNECLARLRRHARRNNVAPMYSHPDPETLDPMATSTLEAPDHAAARAFTRNAIGGRTGGRIGDHSGRADHFGDVARGKRNGVGGRRLRRRHIPRQARPIFLVALYRADDAIHDGDSGLRVAADGALEFTGTAGPGTAVDLLIHLPVVVVLTNTAHPLDPDPALTAVDVLAWRADDELATPVNVEPEYLRALFNTESTWAASQSS